MNDFLSYMTTIVTLATLVSLSLMDRNSGRFNILPLVCGIFMNILLEFINSLVDGHKTGLGVYIPQFDVILVIVLVLWLLHFFAFSIGDLGIYICCILSYMNCSLNPALSTVVMIIGGMAIYVVCGLGKMVFQKQDMKGRKPFTTFIFWGYILGLMLVNGKYVL